MNELINEWMDCICAQMHRCKKNEVLLDSPSILSFTSWNTRRVDVELINPLTPKSDWHLISPYCITPESKIKVRRIKELITN